MAEMAPLVPGQEDTQNAAPPVPSQQETVGLADRWRNWMADPHNRAGLIQFGLALSQPVAAGQNTLGHIGQAVGQAGEASQRVTAEEQKAEELASKQELRGAQAQLSEARSARTADRADYTLGRLQLQRQALDQKALADYYKAVASVQQQNAKIRANNLLLPKEQQQPELPLPTPEQFSGLRERLSPTGGAPKQVNTPEEAQALPSGTRYVTPDGKVYTR